MPIKSPGGYQLLDLKGATLPVTLPKDDPRIQFALKHKKPLILTNYVDPSNYIGGPVILQWFPDQGEFIYPIFVVGKDSVTIPAVLHIHLDDDTYVVAVQEF